MANFEILGHNHLEYQISGVYLYGDVMVLQKGTKC